MMTNATLLHVMAASVLTLSACATSPKTGQRTANEPINTEIRDAAEARSLRISVNMANTFRGNHITLTPDYGIELHGDSVRSFLPYYGRAYRAPLRSESPLDFDCRMTDYTTTETDDGSTRIEFETRTIDDLYKFSIDIFDNGNASIRVTAQQRESITFDGEVDETE